jgi:hypothetical protein
VVAGAYRVTQLPRSSWLLCADGLPPAGPLTNYLFNPHVLLSQGRTPPARGLPAPSACSARPQCQLAQNLPLPPWTARVHVPIDEHEQKRVLVVDDNAGVRTIVAELLRWQGY